MANDTPNQAKLRKEIAKLLECSPKDITFSGEIEVGAGYIAGNISAPKAGRFMFNTETNECIRLQ